MKTGDISDAKKHGSSSSSLSVSGGKVLTDYETASVVYDKWERARREIRLDKPGTEG